MVGSINYRQKLPLHRRLSQLSVIKLVCSVCGGGQMYGKEKVMLTNQSHGGVESIEHGNPL